MPKISYAVEIHFPDLNVTDATIAMVDDATLGYSVMRFVTGRPGYDGNPTLPKWEDDSDNDAVWYEDFLTQQGMSNPSRRVDLNGTGDYGTLSGFDFTIENCMVAGSTEPFWKRAEDAGCNFVNKTVKFFTIIDDKFYQAWQGIISNNPYTETEYKIVCKSDFTSVHKPLPPTVISDTNYPDAIDESKGKAIPVCLGYVPYARMYNIDGMANFIDVVEDSEGIRYKTCQASAYTSDGPGSTAILTLVTGNIIFGELSLNGKYLNICAGGGGVDTSRVYRIKSNYLTDFSSYPYTTQILLDEPLSVSDATFNASYKYGSASFEDVWQFKIAEIGRNNIVSNNAVEFKSNEYGRAQLYDYSSDENRYIDTQYALIDYTSAEPTTIETAQNIVDVDGNINYLFPVRSSLIDATYTIDHAGDQTITVTGAEANVSNLDRSSTYKVASVVASATDQTYYKLSADAYISLNFTENDFNYDELYIAPDYVVNSSNGSSRSIVHFITTYYDQYGNQAFEFDKDITTAYGDYNFISNDYYSNNGNDNGEDSDFGAYISGLDQKDIFGVSDSVKSLLKNGVLNNKVKCRVAFIFSRLGNGNLTGYVEVKEIGVFGTRKIDTIGTTLYTRVNGEKHTGEETNSVYWAFKKILEYYDEISEFDIDYGNLFTVRNLASNYRWVVGRQITERKNSYEYIKELCADSFVALFNSRTGKKKFSAWIDDDSIKFAHTQANILRGSIAGFEKTQSTDLYNDFYVKYAWSPGPEKCAKAYTITKVDQASFPAYGTDDWKQYVGGLDSGAYADAAYLWKWCHEAYLRMGVSRQFERELLWFPDLYTYEGGDTSWGVGADSTAFYFLQNAIQWVTREKAEVSYSIPITAANIAIELCDRITFTDSIYTNGVARDGWIEQVEIDTEKHCINVKAILAPVDGIDDEIPGDIVEIGNAANTITETGSAPDTITEDGNA